MESSEQKQLIVGKNVKDIQLKDAFDVLKRRFWIVILITVIAGSIGYYYKSRNDTPIYETSTRIIIEADNNYMNTLMVMIKDPIIMEKVQHEMDLERSPEAIASQIEVSRIDESQVIKINVIDQDPETAKHIADATARSFKSEIGTILEFNDVQLLSEAKVNNVPINENKNRFLLITIVIGLVTGIGFVFLLDSLDDSVEKNSEVEEILGVPVLGTVSNMKKMKQIPKKLSKEMGVHLRRDKVSVSK